MVSVGDPFDRLRLVNLARQKVHEQNRQEIKHNGMGGFFALQNLKSILKHLARAKLKAGKSNHVR